MTHAIIAANGRAELKSASSSTMWAVLPPNSRSVFTVGASDDDSYQISTRTMLRNNLTLNSIVMLDCRGVLDAAPRRPRPPRPGADTCDKYIPIYQGEDFVRVWQSSPTAAPASRTTTPRGSTTSPSGSPTCAPTTSEAQGCAPNAPAPHVYSRIAVTYIVDPKRSVSSPDSDRV